MKNKGRKQIHGMPGLENCKSCISHITRPIRSMSSKGRAYSKFDKKKWTKRVRGYFKSKTKDILSPEY